jgi:hypothetical protein
MSRSNDVRELKIPFGERDGRLYSPMSVDQGLACKCTCPSCGERLVANQGTQKRPYFSHYQSQACATGYETALHRMAKQIIEDAKEVYLPDHVVSISQVIDEKRSGRENMLYEEVFFEPHVAKLQDVVQEQSVTSARRPDLTASLRNGETLYIEIQVTHAVDPSQTALLDNLMEIDLSGLVLSDVVDHARLEKIVLQSATRRWHRVSLYDDLPKVQEARDNLKDRAKTQRVELSLSSQYGKSIFKNLLEQHDDAENIDLAGDPTLQAERVKQLRNSDKDKVAFYLHELCRQGRLPEPVLPVWAGLEVERMDVLTVSPELWQLHILDLFVWSREAGEIIHLKDVIASIRDCFGLSEWEEREIALSEDHQAKRMAHGLDRLPAQVNNHTGVKTLPPFNTHRAINHYMKRISAQPKPLLSELTPGLEYVVLA